jgi:hypothetical protein
MYTVVSSNMIYNVYTLAYPTAEGGDLICRF